jgi:tetratricopeptide (TPR) repeat protein
MNAIVRVVRVVCGLIIFLFVFGCQSMQKDKLYSSGGAAAQQALADLESVIVPLDAKEGGELKTAAAEARKKVTEIEKSSIKDRDFEGRLAAWSGRLYLIEGKRKDAEAARKNAESLSPGSAEGRILSIRLENDPSVRATLAEDAIKEAAGGSFYGENGVFQIELGRCLYELRAYREAAAAFDTAFPRLAQVYKDTYGALREKAWALRNLEGSDERTAQIALQSEINWDDALELTAGETELLSFITAGKDWPLGDLFKRLVELSIIPPTQDMGVVSLYDKLPSATERKSAVLRAGMAWYLWHLLAENRADKSILTRYSYRYPGRSPIPDLARDSVFFDSILGCVEREFMALADGRNFNGTAPVSGSDFINMIKKLGAQ